MNLWVLMLPASPHCSAQSEESEGRDQKNCRGVAGGEEQWARESHRVGERPKEPREVCKGLCV